MKLNSTTTAWLELLVLATATLITLATIVATAIHLGIVSFQFFSPAGVAAHGGGPLLPLAPAIPASRLPGPPRKSISPVFILNATNSAAMTGANVPLDERWRDVADNPYSSRFRSEFSYETGSRRTPEVRVQISPTGPTFAGRIEARGLKPNFAYQIKLRGLAADRRTFETIGYLGRWRLPGRGTNYSDLDYQRYPDKTWVEAYILFDFMVTDRQGDGLRDFSLDSSLHVLWRESQLRAPLSSDLVSVAVEASDPAVYARPREGLALDFLWAEREMVRYRSADQVIRLPPGAYEAELVLTEETFHAMDFDGGYWATVLSCPVRFNILPPQTSQ